MTSQLDGRDLAVLANTIQDSSALGSRIVIAGSRVIWYGSGGEISSIDKNGGPITTICQDCMSWGFTADQERVYYHRRSSGFSLIESRRLDDNTTTALATVAAMASIIDGTWILWYRQTLARRDGIWRAPKLGGMVEQINANADPIPSANNLALLGGQLFWVEVDNLLYTMDANGGAKSAVSSGGLLLQSHRDSLFWLESSGTASRILTSPGFGSPTVVAEVGGQIESMTVADSFIFAVTSPGQGAPMEILRVAR